MISMCSLSRRAPATSGGGTHPIDIIELAPPVRANLSFHGHELEVGASGVNVMLAKPGRRNRQVTTRHLRSISVQVGSTGGATIAEGVARPDVFVFVRSSAGNGCLMRLDGRGMATSDIAVLPPGRHFALTSSGPHRWISFSVTPAALQQAGFSQAQISTLGAAASLIRAPHASVLQLDDAATDLVDPARWEAGRPIADAAGDRERALLQDLLAAIEGSDAAIDRARSSSNGYLDRIGRQALALLRTEDGPDLHVEDLCRMTGVAERSLLRAFHRLFGIGPTQYMKLLRLNKVHHALQAPGGKATVTAVMTDCGVTELGRFAGEYRALFGESPSETLKRRPETATELGRNIRVQRKMPLTCPRQTGGNEGDPSVLRYRSPAFLSGG